MTETIVDFNKPCIVGKEYEYMADSIRLSHISGDGKYSKQCHAFLKRNWSSRVLTTPSVRMRWISCPFAEYSTG